MPVLRGSRKDALDGERRVLDRGVRHAGLQGEHIQAAVGLLGKARGGGVERQGGRMDPVQGVREGRR